MYYYRSKRKITADPMQNKYKKMIFFSASVCVFFLNSFSRQWTPAIPAFSRQLNILSPTTPCPHRPHAHIAPTPTSPSCPHRPHAHIALMPTSPSRPHRPHAHIALTPTSPSRPHRPHAHIALTPTSPSCPHRPHACSYDLYTLRYLFGL